MGRKRTREQSPAHGAIINQQMAAQQYQRSRFWFYHHRASFTPIAPERFGLSKRCTWYFADEVQRLIRHESACMVA